MSVDGSRKGQISFLIVKYVKTGHCLREEEGKEDKRREYTHRLLPSSRVNS